MGINNNEYSFQNIYSDQDRAGAGIYTSPNNEFYFIGMLKNAHTYFEIQFFKNKWTFVRNFELQRENLEFDKAKKLVILRDPYERWISAFNTLITGQQQGFHDVLPSSFLKLYESDYFEDALDIIFRYSNLQLDNHTKLQFIQLKNHIYRREIDKTFVYFKYENNVQLTLKNFLQNHNIEVFFDEEKINVTDKNSKSFRKIKNFLDNNQKYKEQLINYLEPDYNFIKSITFYED